MSNNTTSISTSLIEGTTSGDVQLSAPVRCEVEDAVAQKFATDYLNTTRNLLRAKSNVEGVNNTLFDLIVGTGLLKDEDHKPLSAERAVFGLVFTNKSGKVVPVQFRDALKEYASVCKEIRFLHKEVNELAKDAADTDLKDEVRLEKKNLLDAMIANWRSFVSRRYQKATEKERNETRKANKVAADARIEARKEALARVETWTSNPQEASEEVRDEVFAFKTIQEQLKGIKSLDILEAMVQLAHDTLAKAKLAQGEQVETK